MIKLTRAVHVFPLSILSALTISSVAAYLSSAATTPLSNNNPSTFNEVTQ